MGKTLDVYKRQVLGIIQVLVFPPLIIGVGFVRSLIPFIVSCIFLILGWKKMWLLLIPGAFLLGSLLGVVFNYPYGGALLGAVSYTHLDVYKRQISPTSISRRRVKLSSPIISFRK